MPMKNRFVDVARTARVSVATVSRVATGSAPVSRETEERVNKIARELGVDLYDRNKSRVIAFLLSNRNMLQPFHSHVLAGAESHCSARGWNMLFLSFRYPAELSWQHTHLPPILQRRDLVRGFVLAGTNTPNLLEAIGRNRIPFSVLGNNVVGEWQPEMHDVVWFDDIHGSGEITRYLLSLGHKDIWFVGNIRPPWVARRYEGYSLAMRDARLNPRLSDVDSDNDLEVGILGTKSLLARREPVSAIFASGDPTAEGVYKCLRDARLRVPQEISIVGFGDVGSASLHPPLTTVRVFAEQVGKRLAELLLNRIARREIAPQTFVVPTQLIRRESCQTLAEDAAADETWRPRISV